MGDEVPNAPVAAGTMRVRDTRLEVIARGAGQTRAGSRNLAREISGFSARYAARRAPL